MGQKKHTKTFNRTSRFFFIYIFRKHYILFLYATYLQLKLYHSTSNKSMTILTNWLIVLKTIILTPFIYIFQYAKKLNNKIYLRIQYLPMTATFNMNLKTSKYLLLHNF